MGLVGTGDLTHPAWLGEILDKLEPAEEGLWRLKPELARLVDPEVPQSCRAPVRFVLQGEISTIYKKAGRTRKVHHLVFLPDRRSAERLISRLERIGNLRGDGRPILGLDSRDLLELVLDASQEAILVPAHVWTPWFSVFGSRSGFEDLEECYGDLVCHISALETGLSSDPAMNWRWSRLDSYRLISNSDAHSPSRLGREANLLDIPVCFSGLREALVTGQGLLGTVEFFPEEGKYHLDGHRACGVRMSARETLLRAGLCPECGRPVTVGVLHRVEELADRDPGFVPPGARPFQRLLPLEEVLGELLGCTPSSRKVRGLYHQLLSRWGPEIPLLSDFPVDRLREASMGPLAEALERMREGRVFLEPGFDGQYGMVHLFQKGELASLQGQISLMGALSHPPVTQLDLKPRREVREPVAPVLPRRPPPDNSGPHGLDARQKEAVFHQAGGLMIVAGPGTGKTRVLTHRIAWLLDNGAARPQEVLAVTFTQRAAREMAQRLGLLLGTRERLGEISVQTLHAYGLGLIRTHWERLCLGPGPIVVADERGRLAALKSALERVGAPGGAQASGALLERISRWKQGLKWASPSQPAMAALVEAYDEELRRDGKVDYDDLLLLALELLGSYQDVRLQARAGARYLFVDEFQDLNPRQLSLLEALLGPETRITVIGDPDQCIYGFRGADPQHLLRLQDRLPHIRVLSLETNYRSTGTIVEGASALIASNPAVFPRSLEPARHRGPSIQVRSFDSDQAEAIFVAQEIDGLLGGTSHWAMLRKAQALLLEPGSVGFGDVAVLCRLHALLPRLEDALSRQGIPCERVVHDEKGTDQGVGQLLDFLRWLLGPIRGPGPDWATRIQDPQALSHRVQEMGAGQALRLLMKELGMHEPGPGISHRAEARALRRFIEAADTWTGHLLDLVEHWSLVLAEGQPEPPTDRVTLMTVHAAKGLEFPVVFVVGCDEGIFPFWPQGDESAPSLEEERRLFYVAMTRAQDILYLTTARLRSLPGGLRGTGPSRFLSEIPSGLISRGEHQQRPGRPPRQLSLF